MVVTFASWRERLRHDERLRFLFGGAWNTLFGYIAYVTLYLLLHERLEYLLIGVLSHALAIVNAFVVHRLLVFRSTGSWAAEFLRFNIAQVGVLAFSLGALWILVRFGRLEPLAAQAITTIAAVLGSYLLHRWFTFANR